MTIHNEHGAVEPPPAATPPPGSPTGRQPQGGRANEALQQVQQCVHDSFDERPISSAFAVFGLALGVGIAAGLALGGQSRIRRQESYAERLQHQFMDALHRAVPDRFS